MNEIQFIKSPSVLSFRRRGRPGLVLVDNESREQLELDADEAKLWSEWPQCWQSHERFGRALAQKRFAMERSHRAAPIPLMCDDTVFRLAGRYVKYLRESADLVVIFNSAPMSQNNPLLVLGPYGSLCWNGVVAGWPVRRIQFEASRVFCTDEVVPFLARLQRLGFIAGDTLLPDAASGSTIQKDFPAPDIQIQMVQSTVPWNCLW